MYKINFILLLIILLSSLSCQNRKSNSTETCDLNQIDSLLVLYYNYDFNGVRDIKCDEIQKYIPEPQDGFDGVYDALITNRNILDEIAQEIDNLSLDNEQYPLDARISATVYYSDGTIKKLCSDGNRLFQNGVLQKMNNHLLFLLKNNAGYYSWFEDPQEYMDELKDTSFVKDAFIESPYYKQYKAMENKDE